MKILWFLRAAVCVALVCPAVIRAQAAGESDLMAMDAAVAHYLHASLPATGVAFEPRVWTPGGWVAARSQTRIAALAAILGATPAYHDTIFVCGHRPSECTLRNTNTLLEFSEPNISGTTAIVHLQRRDRTGLQRIPVSRREIELHLIREGSAWRVVSSALLSET